MEHTGTISLANLPVPEIIDEASFQHSHKQCHRRQEYRLKKPKRKAFNRSLSAMPSSNTAHSISFRGEGNGGLVSELDIKTPSFSYDHSANESFFEQCFTNLAKIGEGSFGEVFKVRSHEDGRLYAVKMSKELFRSETYRAERLEEVRRYEQFSGHANFVQFHRAWEQNDRLYMQMELCRESLDSYLARRQQIPEEKIWNVLLDLLLALKALHDQNLIHLDIKLDNVLVGDDSSCKLADFGLVIDVERANRHQATEGDSRYIAPEILEGNFSKAADVFSLGVAMLELSCFLELPHNGPLWQQLRSGVLPNDFMKSMSPELKTIIKQMMAPNPSLRPTVDELLCNKKLANLNGLRKRWQLVKKLGQVIRISPQNVWIQLCNFKNIVIGFLNAIVTNYLNRDTTADESSTQQSTIGQPTQPIRNLPVPLTRIVASTPTNQLKKPPTLCYDSGLNDNYLPFSHESTPITFLRCNQIVNSTPVNHSNENSRCRKDLTRTRFSAMDVESVSGSEAPKVRLSRVNGISFSEQMELDSQSYPPVEKFLLSRKKLFNDFE